MLGGRIKHLRIKKGYSINELAEKAAVSKSYLSYIERDIQKNPSLQVISKLAKTLDTTVEELLQDGHIIDEKVDEEWVELIQEAILQGMSKEDFSYYLDFIKFKKINDSSK